MKRYGEHRFPGKLFVVEGIDGSGKSTQLVLLHQWLKAEGYGVVFSEWNSSPLVRNITKRGKKKHMLTPATFCLIHATDFAPGEGVQRRTAPEDRDVVRGMDPKWVREIYSFAPKPTVTFYFRVPLEVAMKRLINGRNGFKFYEAGMDLELSQDAEESFHMFQGRIIEEYEKMVPEFEITVVDATQPVEAEQAQMRQLVKSKLAQAKRLRVAP